MTKKISNVRVIQSTVKAVDSIEKKKRGRCKTEKKAKRWEWKKPVGKPNRPLSGYNLFFQAERRRIIGDKSKTGGFSSLAKCIASRWKAMSEESKKPFCEEAAALKIIYRLKLDAWKSEEKEKNTVEFVSDSECDSSSEDGKCDTSSEDGKQNRILLQHIKILNDNAMISDDDADSATELTIHSNQAPLLGREFKILTQSEHDAISEQTEMITYQTCQFEDKILFDQLSYNEIKNQNVFDCKQFRNRVMEREDVAKVSTCDANDAVFLSDHLSVTLDHFDDDSEFSYEELDPLELFESLGYIDPFDIVEDHSSTSFDDDHIEGLSLMTIHKE
jgi:HMG (high mobility group) box